MSRTLVGVLGALTALFPARTVAVFEAFAVADSGDATPRAWVTEAIRSEGVLVAAVALLGGRSYAWLMNLTGASGAVVAAFPGLYRRFAGLFLYDRPDSVEWTERFTTGVRLVGVLYVLLGLEAYRGRRGDT